jgi:hypothetical protein
MKYYETNIMPNCTSEELKQASNTIKEAFPNGPAVRTVKPNKVYSYNEIAANIRISLGEISKSLY